MYKIIDLDIDGTLTGDTRIEEVAFVEMPAVEQNFIYFASEKSFIVPQNVASNACRARKYKEENGSSCGTNVGWTRSSQLCERKPISLDTVKRMYSYFSRHQVDLESSKSYDDGCGLLMWDAWGGNEGKDWSERLVQREEGFDYDTSNLPVYADYPTGDTENNMLVKPVLFIEKVPYEKKDDYINRCVEYHIKNKGMESDQAYAVCVSQADEAFALGQKVSFDYDETITNPRGMGLAIHEINSGSDVYIISARSNKEGMLKRADELKIPHSRVFATGSNKAKIQKIKDLRIDKHYDNNEDVIKELGTTGIQFNCPCLDEFALEDACWDGYEPIGMKEKDGKMVPNCVPIKASKEDFALVGFIDGEPVFSTPEEAILYGDKMKGCASYHVHTDEDGNEVYMGCNIHPEKMESEFGVEDYTEEEIEVVKLLKFLKETNYEKFEAVVGSMRGATESEIKKRNHKNPTIYFKYERKLTGAPDRDFCTSIEDRYFRRLEIDLLRDLNTEFGHERQPYSKWLYKGGPQCVHAFRKFIVQGQNFADRGWAEGKAGMAPKEMPNNGYYSEETKRKSEVAYIISQQNMSKQEFKGEVEKRMVYGPLMIPNILIPRMDEDTNEKYFVKFTAEAVEKMQQLYMIEKRQDKTNYEHTSQKMSSIVMVESWIVSGESDKAYQLGFKREDIPDGTWMGGYKVMDTPEGDYLWNEFIKTGKVKGFSVEGEFQLKFSRQKSDEYLLEEIINILKTINN
jgi:hypothetical protein